MDETCDGMPLAGLSGRYPRSRACAVRDFITLTRWSAVRGGRFRLYRILKIVEVEISPIAMFHHNLHLPSRRRTIGRHISTAASGVSFIVFPFRQAAPMSTMAGPPAGRRDRDATGPNHCRSASETASPFAVSWKYLPPKLCSPRAASSHRRLDAQFIHGPQNLGLRRSRRRAAMAREPRHIARR